MKTIEIIGYKRANLGKTEAKKLRLEGLVPCVMYGGKKHLHFSVPMILFREIVYTNEAHFILINPEGEKKPIEAIIQDIQFHPVSEMILHVDFLELKRGTPIKMKIPVRSVGSAPGIQVGGKLITKLKYLSIKALPKNMPEYIQVDVSNLQLGKSVKVGELETKDYHILNSPLVTILSIEVPRALKTGGVAETDEGEEATTD